MTKISQYLAPESVKFFRAASRDEAIRSLIDQLAGLNRVPDKERFHRAILEREKIVTTGIGMGVAIPHAKLPDYDDFFIAVGILESGVDWGALDETPVRLIFLIGGPEDKQTEYLQILSALTTTLKEEERRKKLLTASSPEAVLQLLQDV